MQAVDDHGRVITTSWQAATWYRHAQRTADLDGASTALRLAVATDPAFALAIADLAAITRTTSQPATGRLMNWERHHIEVVHSAAAHDFDRAADMLRELLASIGCDPLAMRIVVSLAERTERKEELDDLTLHPPSCHRIFN